MACIQPFKESIPINQPHLFTLLFHISAAVFSSSIKIVPAPQFLQATQLVLGSPQVV
jgi:hypothetical protein